MYSAASKVLYSVQCRYPAAVLPTMLTCIVDRSTYYNMERSRQREPNEDDP